MDRIALPARLGYATAGAAAAGAGAFALAIAALPRLSPGRYGPGIGEGYLAFQAALLVAGVAAFSTAMVGLTLPGIRRRRRGGRRQRTAAAAAFVVVVSMAFAGLGHTLFVDLLFAAWLAYVVAFTFVRYGVLDSAERRGRGTTEAIAKNYLE